MPQRNQWLAALWAPGCKSHRGAQQVARLKAAAEAIVESDQFVPSARRPPHRNQQGAPRGVRVEAENGVGHISADHADRGVGPTLQHPWHKPALATCRSQCWRPRCSLLAARCWLFRAAIEPSRHMHRGHGGSVSDQQAGNCLAYALTDMNFKGKHDRTATHTHGAHTTTIVLSLFCLGVVYVRT